MNDGTLKTQKHIIKNEMEEGRQAKKRENLEKSNARGGKRRYGKG